ncbi:hypothetical protein GCM10028792_40190 [Salinisphaera aquimarina]
MFGLLKPVIMVGALALRHGRAVTIALGRGGSPYATRAARNFGLVSSDKPQTPHGG